MQIQDLGTPALLIDRNRVIRNVQSMKRKAAGFGVKLRPHIKTHKCIEVGRIQEKEGISGITVSTLKEAEIFASYGFSNILYAVPMQPFHFDWFLKINEKASIKAIVDNARVASILDNKASKANQEVEVLLKVDIGYHRCGVDPANPNAISIVKTITEAESLVFKGILTHAGNSYSCTSPSCIRQIAKQEQDAMVTLAYTLAEHDSRYNPEIISIGSTPTVVLTEDVRPEITEIRPGNYVYYDYTQVKLGTCRISDCALTVLGRIVGKYDGRIVADTGATALSKDRGPIHIEPKCGYGKIYTDYDENILDEHSTIDNLSQEHGKISFGEESVIQSLNIGDTIRILPNHSCLTNNLFSRAYVVDGNRVVGEWQVHSGHS